MERFCDTQIKSEKLVLILDHFKRDGYIPETEWTRELYMLNTSIFKDIGTRT